MLRRRGPPRSAQEALSPYYARLAQHYAGLAQPLPVAPTWGYARQGSAAYRRPASRAEFAGFRSRVPMLAMPLRRVDVVLRGSDGALLERRRLANLLI